jgi:hypothetical protein
MVTFSKTMGTFHLIHLSEKRLSWGDLREASPPTDPALTASRWLEPWFLLPPLGGVSWELIRTCPALLANCNLLAKRLREALRASLLSPSR